MFRCHLPAYLLRARQAPGFVPSNSSKQNSSRSKTGASGPLRPNSGYAAGRQEDALSRFQRPGKNRSGALTAPPGFMPTLTAHNRVVMPRAAGLRSDQILWIVLRQNFFGRNYKATAQKNFVGDKGSGQTIPDFHLFGKVEPKHYSLEVSNGIHRLYHRISPMV